MRPTYSVRPDVASFGSAMQAVATAVATARPSTPPPSAAVPAVTTRQLQLTRQLAVPLVITPPSPEWGAMTVVQLKEELRSRSLRLGGKKAELIERLSGATAAEAVATPPPAAAAAAAPAPAPAPAVPAAAAADASAALDAGFRLLDRTMAELPTAELDQTFVHHQVMPTLIADPDPDPNPNLTLSPSPGAAEGVSGGGRARARRGAAGGDAAARSRQIDGLMDG